MARERAFLDQPPSGRGLPAGRGAAEGLSARSTYHSPTARSTSRRPAAWTAAPPSATRRRRLPAGQRHPRVQRPRVQRRWKEALDLLLATNCFPEFTGRICPAPCEGACVLGLIRPAVNICKIELAIIEQGFQRGYVTAEPAECAGAGARGRGRLRPRGAGRGPRAQPGGLQRDGVREGREAGRHCCATASPTSSWRSGWSTGAST